jgi:hypothetical protein
MSRLIDIIGNKNRLARSRRFIAFQVQNKAINRLLRAYKLISDSVYRDEIKKNNPPSKPVLKPLTQVSFILMKFYCLPV